MLLGKVSFLNLASERGQSGASHSAQWLPYWTMQQNNVKPTNNFQWENMTGTAP